MCSAYFHDSILPTINWQVDYMGICRRHLLKAVVILSAIIVCLFFYIYSAGRNKDIILYSTNVAIDSLEEQPERIKSDVWYQDINEVVDGSARPTPLAPKASVVNIVMTFAKAKANLQLQKKLQVCISSMLQHASGKNAIYMHFIGDVDSTSIAKDIVVSAIHQRPVGVNTTDIKIIAHNVDDIAAATRDVILPLKRHFIYKPGSYYSDLLFFFSIALHTVLMLDRVIVLDVDLKFLADVSELYDQFDRFDKTQLIGIASEQQPVYRHIFHSYRKSHPGTFIGDHPPNGFAGFNSAVLLLDLQKMRSSKLYANLLKVNTVESLVKKYYFHGHLGDQDYFTLIGAEHPSLFYVLPCGWNRQLCQWWRGHGYQEVFEDYHRCKGTIQILHGNCNTPIPEGTLD